MSDTMVTPTVMAPAPKGVFRRFLAHSSGVIGFVLLLGLVLSAIIGPIIWPVDLLDQNLEAAFQGPSAQHWFGTDNLGRDVFGRIILGARYSLALGIIAVVIGLVVGVPLGAVSGYFGGKVDLIIQRINDALLSLPNILLALALVAAMGVGLVNVAVAVGISAVPAFVRLSRSAALTLRELDYVSAARILGVKQSTIVRRHIIPNLISPVVVQASTEMGAVIIAAAGLGFLGLGVQPPTPEWGTMLAESRNYIFDFPMLTVVPGIAIFLAVLSFNLIGDGLRDAMDPRLGSR